MVSCSTINQALKRAGISNKKGEHMDPQSKLLHESWQAYMLTVTAEQLVFINEPHTGDKAPHEKPPPASSAPDGELPHCDAYLLPIEEPLQPHVQPSGAGPPPVFFYLFG